MLRTCTNETLLAIIPTKPVDLHDEIDNDIVLHRFSECLKTVKLPHQHHAEFLAFLSLFTLQCENFVKLVDQLSAIARIAKRILKYKVKTKTARLRCDQMNGLK